MTIEEILAGESKNVEFKENLPEKSIKYMKSVVAFTNGNGGKIIFGIADKTREVIGFGKEEVFKIMDAIANAVSDSCEPAIIPDITLQTIGGKTVIVVEVSAGRQRPYYIKSLGKESGVYVRVASTTRLADEYMVKELMFEGSNRRFDQALCTGWNNCSSMPPCTAAIWIMEIFRLRFMIIAWKSHLRVRFRWDKLWSA